MLFGSFEQQQCNNQHKLPRIIDQSQVISARPPPLPLQL